MQAESKTQSDEVNEQYEPPPTAHAPLMLPATHTKPPMPQRCRSLEPLFPVDMSPEEIKRAEALNKDLGY
jgi:hypothetical protein|eukprot:5754513-Prymnesium_polylepis.1